MFFIVGKHGNSVLEQIKYLQIQDRTLVNTNHLRKYHPVPICSGDTQEYQDTSSHSAFSFSLLQLDSCQSVTSAVPEPVCGCPPQDRQVPKPEGDSKRRVKTMSNLCPCE